MFLSFFFYLWWEKRTSSVDTSESSESCRFGQNAQLYKIGVRRGLVSVPRHKSPGWKSLQLSDGKLQGQESEASLSCCLWVSVLWMLWSSQDFPHRGCHLSLAFCVALYECGRMWDQLWCSAAECVEDKPLLGTKQQQHHCPEHSGTNKGFSASPIDFLQLCFLSLNLFRDC